MRRALLVLIGVALVPLAASAGPDAPPNDDRADAITIDRVPFTHSTDLRGASTEPDEPTDELCGEPVSNTVWYRYAATDRTVLILESAVGTRQASITLWRITVTGLEQTGCPGSGRRAFDLRADTTYLFQVGLEPGRQAGRLVFEADPPAGIRGRITVPDAPRFVTAMGATAKPLDDDGNAASSCAGGDGTYEVNTLKPGRYRIQFGQRCEDPLGVDLSEWYDDMRDERCATVLVVEAGRFIEGIDAELDEQREPKGSCPETDQTGGARDDEGTGPGSRQGTAGARPSRTPGSDESLEPSPSPIAIGDAPGAASSSAPARVAVIAAVALLVIAGTLTVARYARRRSG